MTAPHCGRLDRHDPHEWVGNECSAFWIGHLSMPVRVLYKCPGVIVTEGAAMPLCEDCGDQPAAAHGWGKCRWCWGESRAGVAAS